MVQTRKGNILSKTYSCLPLNTWPTAERRGHGGQIFCYGKLQKLSENLTKSLCGCWWCQTLFIHQASSHVGTCRCFCGSSESLHSELELIACPHHLPPPISLKDSQSFAPSDKIRQKSRHGGVQSKERRVVTVSTTLHLHKP